MSCGPNRTCHAACDCREAQWAEKLAAAERERDDATAAANIRAAEHRQERDRAAAAEARHAGDDAKVRTLVSKALAAVRGQEAAEERARELEGALKDEIGWLSDMGERTQHLVIPASCRERAWKLAALLTPPPEAEKRGEG